MKDFVTGKKGILFLVIIFCLMYILSSLTPLLADDYFSAFVWSGKTARLNDVSCGAVRRVSSFVDVCRCIKAYYLTWGGRVPGCFPVTFFIWQGKEYFNIFNTIFFTLLVAEIYWLSHEGRVTVNFNPSYIFGIFFALWAFNASFIDTCLWLAGSCNYLWMLAVVLAFFIPYVRNYFDAAAFKNYQIKLAVGMFFLGVLAGWSHETTNCWIVLVLSYWLYQSYKKGDLQRWQIMGYIGFCIGYALLIFAPGNFSRLQMQQNTSSVVIASNLLYVKLVELFVILFFHFIIWYFIFSFFFKYQKLKAEFKQKETKLYISIALSFIVIALGSGVTMFFIPSNGLRPSFLNLVYLVVASAMLLRLQEVNKIFFVRNYGTIFLKSVGCLYLIITVSFSLWGSYINKCHLDDILVKVHEASNRSSDAVLEFPPPPTMKSDMWFYGSGFHLVPLPISQNESHQFNKTFSYYYGIKGIRLSKE